jgi:hypothetical protein
MEPASPADRGSPPVIRLFFHLARTGGTVLSKCIASMAGVVLLSEINPRGLRWMNPLLQAHSFHELLRKDDLAPLLAGATLGFDAAIRLIHARAAERGAALVLRDWTHLDYVGLPFVQPTYALGLERALAGSFRVVKTASVRHPIDQWLSLSRLDVMQGKLDRDLFLRGYRRFAEQAATMGFLRYERFVDEPDAALRVLCERLELPFDPTYRDRWSTYERLTGEVAGRRDRIAAPARPPLSGALLDAFAANQDYRDSLEMLGYTHPSTGEGA